MGSSVGSPEEGRPAGEPQAIARPRAQGDVSWAALTVFNSYVPKFGADMLGNVRLYILIGGAKCSGRRGLFSGSSHLGWYCKDKACFFIWQILRGPKFQYLHRIFQQKHLQITGACSRECSREVAAAGGWARLVTQHLNRVPSRDTNAGPCLIYFRQRRREHAHNFLSRHSSSCDSAFPASNMRLLPTRSDMGSGSVASN